MTSRIVRSGDRLPRVRGAAILRVLAVICSIALVAGYIAYQTRRASRQNALRSLSRVPVGMMMYHNLGTTLPTSAPSTATSETREVTSDFSLMGSSKWAPAIKPPVVAERAMMPGSKSVAPVIAPDAVRAVMPGSKSNNLDIDPTNILYGDGSVTFEQNPFALATQPTTQPATQPATTQP